VMREFNTRIEEQYGENFKQLNQAVGQMISWQKEHREAIEALVESNRQSAESARLGAESFERLIQQTRSFTSVAEDMEALLSTLQTQSKNLREYLSTFSSLVVDAQQGLPQMESRILQLTEGMQQLVETQGQQMRTLLEGSATDIRDTVKNVSDVLMEGTERAQQNMGTQLTQLLERNDKQMKQMDQALESELNRAMKSFGYQLTALSEKFVNDYTPLTDKLHDLVRLADQSK
ncbi:MAG: hypothetical protein WD668_00480, partial [Saccharospirillum sp.]